MVGRGISRRAWGSPSLGERYALAWRKVTFRTAKGMVSRGKRYGFAEWLLSGCQLSVRQWVALCVLSLFSPWRRLLRGVFLGRDCASAGDGRCYAALWQRRGGMWRKKYQSFFVRLRSVFQRLRALRKRLHDSAEKVVCGFEIKRLTLHQLRHRSGTDAFRPCLFTKNYIYIMCIGFVQWPISSRAGYSVE